MYSLCDPCEYSKTENLATFKCLDCDELYCEKCSLDHGKFRAFRNHKVVKLEQHRETASVYENFNLETDLSQLTLDDSATRHDQLYSGSDELAADNKNLYAGSDALETDKAVIYAGSDDLEMDKDVIYVGSDDLEESQYADFDDDHLPANRFTIDVDDTPLARAIGIKDQQCLLIVSMATFSISISHNGVQKFHSNLACMRKYGYKAVSKRFIFEFGRRAMYGEGILLFEIKDRTSGELCQRIRDAEEAYGGKIYSTDK